MKKRYWLRGGIIGLILGCIIAFLSRDGGVMWIPLLLCNYETSKGLLGNCGNGAVTSIIALLFAIIILIPGLVFMFLGWVYGKMRG